MLFYIDPGTGSMLFTILIGVLSAGVYAIRNLILKLRFSLSGGKQVDTNSNRKPLVIFTDDKRYSTVFEPICDELEKREFETVYMTASKDDPLLSKKYEHIKTEFIGEGNRAFARLNMLKADIVLSSTPGLDVYQWKRSRDVKYYVHIFHACTDVVIYKLFGIDYYDALMVSGEYQIDQIRELERKRNLKEKELIMIGQPYMDTMWEKLKGSKDTEEKKDVPTVLLAPSWGESSIFAKFGDEIIDELIKTGYNIIIRPHPQSYKSEIDLMERLEKKYSSIEWNKDTDNFEVLRKSDILISDFSGVMFDFALVFDKPVIYSDISYFNRDPYDAHNIDDELWVFKALPKLGKEINKENVKDIKSVIDECLLDKTYKENRDKAREETWANIGHSAELAADYLIKKYEEINS